MIAEIWRAYLRVLPYAVFLALLTGCDAEPRQAPGTLYADVR